jgi:predicted transcriptional regulator YdeE
MGAKLLKFEVINFPNVRLLGKSIIVPLDIGINDHIIEDLWKIIKENGSLDYLLNMTNKLVEDKDYVGWMGNFNPGDKQYTYIAGVLFDSEIEVPKEYEYRDITNCEMAIGWLQGTSDDESGDIHVDGSSIISGAMKENGYEYDGKNGFFEMEYYSYERFQIPEKQGKEVILDFYSPCKRLKK